MSSFYPTNLLVGSRRQGLGRLVRAARGPARPPDGLPWTGACSVSELGACRLYRRDYLWGLLASAVLDCLFTAPPAGRQGPEAHAVGAVRPLTREGLD